MKVKRHPAFQDLSRDHFQVLVRCQAIRKAKARRAADTEWLGLGTEFLAFYESDLNPHFVEEEEFLLPLAVKTPALAQLVSTVRLAHDEVRALVAGLQSAIRRKQGVATTLRALEPILDAHVRFEENELFQRLQSVASEQALGAMWRTAHEYRLANRAPSACGIHPGPSA